MTRTPATAIAVAASIGAGVIHLALGPEHLVDLGALGWGFYGAAALQLGWVVATVAVLAAPRGASNLGPWVHRVAGAGIAMNVAILGAWAVSRTVGLPAGEMPWVPEPVGRPDLVSAALEIGIVAILAVQLRAASSTRLRLGPRRGPARLATALSIALIVAGTAIGVAPDDTHAVAHEDGQPGHMHLPEDVELPAP